MSNVIAFPKSKKDSPPQTLEELHSKIEETRKDHIEYLIDMLMPMIFGACQDEGFDLVDEENMKPTALFVESFKAALYCTAGIEHPLHIAAEELCILEEDNEETKI